MIGMVTDITTRDHDHGQAKATNTKPTMIKGKTFRVNLPSADGADIQIENASTTIPRSIRWHITEDLTGSHLNHKLPISNKRKPYQMRYYGTC